MSNRKKFFLIILLVLIIFIPIIVFKFFYHEQGTFYELKMSKYYKNKKFNTIFVSRIKPDENKGNPQVIENKNSERSSKIFNYLNKFNLTEYKNNDKLSNWDSRKYNGIYRLAFVSDDDGTILAIRIYDENHIKLSVSGTQGLQISKYYKINNGTISSEKLEESLK